MNPKASLHTRQKTKKTAPKNAPAKEAKLSRLDLAVARQAGISRESAQALILAGNVKVGGVTQRKASTALHRDAHIEIVAGERYVGRGGYKLERALEQFGWTVRGLRCLDVGASTGGFTDCLLQHGAADVVAVDVGYGHLAWSLRQNPKVIVVERTNFRTADLEALGAPFDFVTADVSFISLTKLAAQLEAALGAKRRIIVLVKPQFEAGRLNVERGGVVRDPCTHVETIRTIARSLEEVGLRPERLTYSPIKGPAGNIEFLLGASHAAQPDATKLVELDVEGVVRAAHEALSR